ncbi:hypothetical protein SAPIO_CDS2756 [Scedosporium apiospermum]|uniref:Uncharacterized protein n=1 Tax=Pseudallescheria apiosperma TaxID=563466 RepID=A0A084GBG8_PSEDA|nr:uncharacterized protein SAPIO_CDS2756 [Scedosporium apiospermum]KEZ44680.1 hypothetical protein SAPIO_CDS2756 [Scedosporium apiospermum]
MRAKDVDPDNPSASDPKPPPSSIKHPPRPQSISENPFAGNSATARQNNDVEAYAGDLIFEKDSLCNDGQKRSLEIAAWDALTPANFGAKRPVSAREIATWRAYIGPDFSTQQDRIVVSCKDTKNWCSTRIDGKSVGGYAWTKETWFGSYQHITLCPVYFGLDSLEEKFEMIEKGLASGETKYAEQAEWQKNKGQFFLHEMMHLKAVGDPDIGDERVEETGRGPMAYGPHLYFYDATGYFPRPPKFRDIADIDNISAEDEDRARDIFPVYLGESQGDTSDEEVQKRFQAELDGMRTAPPTTTNPPADLCKSDNDCSSPLCAGGGVVYSCIQGTCQCGSPEPPAPAPINTPPAGTRCYENVSEAECTGNYECPIRMKPGMPSSMPAEGTASWGEMTPLDRWRNSPPDEEPVSWDAISKAIGNGGVSYGTSQRIICGNTYAKLTVSAMMKDWKGCRGLEAAVALLVENAMPPYLIGLESNDLEPFSASHKNQEGCGLEEGRPSVHPTRFEMLTAHLGEFVKIKKGSGISITDEMLQREARMILYGEDDPWNQTPADNPEWLNLFKTGYGLCTPWGLHPDPTILSTTNEGTLGTQTDAEAAVFSPFTLDKMRQAAMSGGTINTINFCEAAQWDRPECNLQVPLAWQTPECLAEFRLMGLLPSLSGTDMAINSVSATDSFDVTCGKNPSMSAYESSFMNSCTTGVFADQDVAHSTIVEGDFVPHLDKHSLIALRATSLHFSILALPYMAHLVAHETHLPSPSKAYLPLLAKSCLHETMSLLLSFNPALQGRTEDGETALHIAARKGCLICLRQLINSGMDVDCENSKAWTALMVAARYGQVEAADELIRAGARWKLHVRWSMLELM